MLSAKFLLQHCSTALYSIISYEGHSDASLVPSTKIMSLCSYRTAMADNYTLAIMGRC